MSSASSETDASSEQRRRFARKSTLLVLLSALLSAATSVWVYSLGEREGLNRMLELGTERVALYAAALESEVGRVAHIPGLVAVDAEMASMMRTPTPAARANAELRLTRLNARVGSRIIFVVAGDGSLLASSDGVSEPARIARLENITRELQLRGQGLFLAETLAEGTDHYQLHEVFAEGRKIGVVVVGLNLAPLEVSWVDLAARSAGEKLLVVDGNDVVVMSSVPAWKYRTLTPVSASWLGELSNSSRYPSGSLGTLDYSARDKDVASAKLVQLANAGADLRGPYIAQRRYVHGLGLEFVTLSDPADVMRSAQLMALAAAVTVVLLGISGLYLLHRHRAMQQLFAARNQLQRARDELEQEVARRTHELVVANDELERQIAQRQLSESELIQASKLAVLGQMSVGIAHELNQPLTALRALASNTSQLLAAGRPDDAQRSVRAMSDAAERMGRITKQLKTFARRSESGMSLCDVAAAFENVRNLLAHRSRAADVHFELALEGCRVVRADPTRLEQVLLNLLSNALDAVAGRSERWVGLSAHTNEGRVRVCVADNGPGIPADAMRRLFEPFYTTKPAGEGLGLGLVISAQIVADFGSTLQALARPGGGMIFEFQLEAVKNKE